ncbi:hypothetical protein BXZ70DRAFT_926915 [Cristinia sonorae]|uniref:TFIIB-type domain-containing protein n=1 Tax=Cristinia sonorae TaxID=1940300 RepID=A0A8K0UTI7_9AGAR|nr:hypothetical protein BXZ70DRAFT_926915 [Cristinia sonorae]
MRETCVDCGELTIWEQDLGSSICTSCGTLSNPSQSVLSSHLEVVDTSGHDYSQYWSNSLQGRSAVKGKNGWNLPGQDKEASYRKNTAQMHEFIRSVTMKLSNPGVAGRAQHIFDSSMQRGRYRWGRKAKLTAGASVAIALREASKADSIRDIAYLLEESSVSIGRSFTAITQLLQLSLTSADPSLHLSGLQNHLLSLLQEPQSRNALPKDLHKSLEYLIPNLHDVTKTATSLSALANRLDDLTGLPTGPTACAILILSLEAELGTSLPNVGALAQALGARVGMSKRVVMERYKVIYDQVEQWIKEVPWLEGHQRKKGRSGGQGRSKVAKRVVVARGLKDVVHFQDELWQKRMDSLTKPQLDLEDNDEENDSEDGDVGIGSSEGQPFLGGTSDVIVTSSRPATSSTSSATRHQMKRPTPQQRAVTQTSQFFLNPLSLSSSSVPLVDTTGSNHKLTSDPDLFQHLLTVDDASLSHVFNGHPPTRLQKLIALRGGADQDLVDDDELFEDGELEGMFRTAEEIRTLKDAFGWDPTDLPDPSSPGKARKTKRKRAPAVEADGHEGESSTAGPPPPKRTKRINMDALAKLLDPDTSLEDDPFPHTDDGPCFSDPIQEEHTAESPSAWDGEEVVGEWRPMSPGGGFDDDRYET